MSSVLLTDKFKKTVVIPVLIKNGKIECLDGSELPEINDVIAHLVVPALAIKDKEILKTLSDEKEVSILEKDTLLLAQIKIDGSDKLNNDFLFYLDYVREKYHPSKDIGGLINAGFVEVILMNDLFITLRGTKKAKLKSCKCYIPFLKKEAYSLNHAYTLISQEFEKWRISHSGNVFKDIYCLENKRWTSIDNIREHIEYKDKKI